MMKKLMVLVVIVSVLLSACGAGQTEETTTAETETTEETTESETSEETDASANSLSHTPVTINPSPDKYTWYIKDYVGKNCASIGYTSLGGDRMDSYGAGLIELIYVSVDGTYIDIESDDVLQQYYVIAQSLAPNTELKLGFSTDSEGNEYENLVNWQSFEEIVLSVTKVGDTDSGSPSLTAINPSPDKYTWYVDDYVGRNLANAGYTSLGGDLLDTYGQTTIELIIVASDGSFVDPSDSESLKNYVVTGQNISPNTEVDLVFTKDSEGNEYENLVESQNIEEIELYVERLPGEITTGVGETSDEESSEAASTDETGTAEANADEASVDETTVQETSAAGELVDGMRPEFKDAMDSYEAFYDEYCDYMTKYYADPTDTSLLSNYSSLMQQYNEMNQEFEEWGGEDLNSEELSYYTEVNARVLQKLSNLSQQQ